jgi:glycosyltransferase involved in cell wall biosynthesis
MPKVSIITPVYNCDKYITQTMESVLSQDYRDIEYIVIDDGSTDLSAGVIHELSRQYQDGCLKVVYKENQGEQVTVNLGLSLVKGKYFMVVNADDPLYPGAISKLVDFMDSHPKILCAYPDWNMIDENGSLISHQRTREYDFGWMVRHHTCIPSVGAMFRSTVLQSVGYRDTSFRWVGDFDYWLRLGLVGNMARVPHTLASWRLCSGQGSQDKSDARAAEHVRVIGELFRYRFSNTDNNFHLLSPSILKKIEEIKDIKIYLNLPPLKVTKKPKSIEPEAVCWSHLIAAAVCKTKRTQLYHLAKAVCVYPQLMLQARTYKTIIRRGFFYLKRRLV